MSFFPSSQDASTRGQIAHARPEPTPGTANSLRTFGPLSRVGGRVASRHHATASLHASQADLTGFPHNTDGPGNASRQQLASGSIERLDDALDTVVRRRRLFYNQCSSKH